MVPITFIIGGEKVMRTMCALPRGGICFEAYRSKPSRISGLKNGTSDKKVTGDE